MTQLSLAAGLRALFVLCDELVRYERLFSALSAFRVESFPPRRRLFPPKRKESGVDTPPS